MAKTFKFSRQFDQMDCGPACVRMIAKHYGRDYPLSFLRTVSHLSREGVSISGIRKALEQIGIKSASFEMTIEQLCKKCPLPVILHWEQNHFVVLYKISWNSLKKEYRFHIANPAYGKHTMNQTEFSKCWLNGEKGVLIAMETTEEFFNKPSVKEKHSLINFTKKYVWPYKKELIQLSFGLLGGTLLSLISPFMTQAMVDNGINQRDMGVISTILIAQICIFLGSFVMGIISSWVTLFMGTRININILLDYLKKLLKLPVTFFETKSVGDYNQRIADHGRLQNFTTQATLNTAFSIVSASVLLVVMGYYSILILTVYLALTGAATAWMSYFWKKRKSLDYESFRVSSKMQSKLYEMMSGITDIKINAYSEYKINEWKGLQEQNFKMNQKSLRLGQIQSTGYTMLGQIRNILISFWIAAEVVNGNLTLGMMMSISNIIGQVNGPLSSLIGFLQQFQDAKISLERSEEVYLCKNEDTKDLISIPCSEPLDIKVNNLTFCYTGSIGKAVLKNVSLNIPAGKMTAIVGESGSGKTTLMKLFLKFYAPTTGSILLGNKELSAYSAESIRQQTGIVMQENFIFSDTILNNIILGEPFDQKRLDKAIDLACLADYVSELPLGIYTKIGTDGIGVSGGEKQRIMIARAIYKQPLYVMFDEATSSLDADNEHKITMNISKEFKGCTLLIIAHRLSTVRNADNIIVLRHGEIVESGTHAQLIDKKGYYYELVKNQLELANE